MRLRHFRRQLGLFFSSIWKHPHLLFSWRGSIVTVLIIIFIELSQIEGLMIPSSFLILLTIVLLIASTEGLKSGLISAFIVSIYLIYESFITQDFSPWIGGGIPLVIGITLMFLSTIILGKIRDHLLKNHLKTEISLRQEQKFTSTILALSGALIIVLDRQGRIVSFNQTCEKVSGYSFAEVEGKMVWDILLLPFEVECVKAVFNQLKSGQFPKEYENYWLTKTENYRLISWSNTGLLNANGEIEYIIASGIDITERKQMEEAFKNLALGFSVSPGEAFFQSLVQYLGKALGVEYVLIDEIIKFQSLRTVAFLIEGKIVENFDYDIANSPCEQVLKQQKICLYSRHLKQQFPLALYLQSIEVESYLGIPLIASSGKILGLISVMSKKPLTDTHWFEEILGIFAVRVASELERQHTEISLKTENSFRNQVIQEMAEGLCVCNEITPYPFVYFTVWNQRMTEITGYSLVEINQKGWYKSLYPDPEVQQKARKRMEKMRQGDNLMAEEWEITRANGEKRTLAISTSILESCDGIIHTLALIQDITQRKQAEIALRESEQRYANLAEISPVGIFRADTEGKCLYVNQKWCELTGLTQSEAIGKSCLDVLYPDNLEEILENWSQSMLDYCIFTAEYRFQHPDNQVTWGFGQIIAEKNHQGDIISYVGTITNISDRKRIEAMLTKVNQDLESRVIQGSTQLQMTNKRLVAEIKERKQAEEKVNTAIKEIETLLKEIHHRVKNNLLVVSSILEFQAEQTEEPELVAILEESQNRIYSMALIHENLYQSKKIDKVDFSEYLRTLIAKLLSSYSTNEQVISSYLNLEDIYLNIETAHPCGLIVNELISNAIKHAFPQNKNGKLWIEMSQNENQQITLIIKDNGIGFPQELDFYATESLGLQLVCTLVKQLEGQMILERNNGSQFSLTFSELKYRKRLSPYE